MNNSPFSEVVESSLQSFTAQCWQWNQMPPFGSLVTVTQGQRTVFGIVYEVHTGSLDPNRVVQAYQKTEQELRMQQPQIFAFLRTTYAAVIVGYQSNDSITYQLALQPPSIHTFVSYATQAQQAQFFATPDYIYRLCHAPLVTNLDELLLLLFKQQYQAGMSEKQLQSLFEALSLCWQHDYRRLKIFTRRVT